MKQARLFGRSRWGTASAGFLAALFLALSGPASAGIADTKHNLGSGTGPAGRNQVSDTAEVCVFCHTPHGGATGAPVPLWNKRLGVGGAPAGGGSYTTYDTLQTPSLDGTVAQTGSVSMACLSCHDGTQAMDNVINAPGSGGVVANGGDGTNNGNDGRGFTWSGTRVTAAGVMQNADGFIANLGTDLTNDHPIGIQYCGGGITATDLTASTACTDKDFRNVNTQVINGNQIFWVETGTADNAKTRTDLPLYQRGGADASLGPLVECASCHDPHVSAGQAGPNGLNAGETFLRVSNASSAVCTACHVK